ncbi:hypothetical protein BH11PSE11_BH11PSE11_34400 [soil metagenome]
MSTTLSRLASLLIIGSLSACMATGSSGDKSGGIGSALSSATSAVGGIGGTSGKTDKGMAADAVGDLFKAATLSDADVIARADDAIREMDRTNKIAPANSKYTLRLNKLFGKHKGEDGMKLDYKVYLVKDVNAFAMANGSIRVFAGLMDKFTDDELLFVIGHELGHVKLQHSKEQLKAALLTSAARKGVASQNSVAGNLASGDLGALAESAMNAKFSRTDESASDEYSVQFMAKHKYKVAAAETALKKLSSMGENTSFLSGHPAAGERAAKVAEKAATLAKN